jgi:hypothetical protein
MMHEAVHMHVATYQDVDRLESEIARLLRCDHSRSPAYTSTLSYMRFRSRLIGMVFGISSSSSSNDAAAAAAQVYLPQGLVVKCCCSCTQDIGGVSATVGWENGRCVYEEEKQHRGTDGKKNSGRHPSGTDACKGGARKRAKKGARVLYSDEK